jgi:hypothetical protein
MRKKKQRENINIVEKKQRMKRMKAQKEKKQKKENSELDSDGDVKMQEAATTKKLKVKGTEIAKIKSKRSADTATADEEPKLKKKKKAADSEEKDMFFMKPEDDKKKTKVASTTKKTVTKKTLAKKDAASAPEAAVEEKVAKPVVPVVLSKAQAKAQTGVVGVVDKTKKIKPTSKPTSDIVAALESENKKQDNVSTGTGLDVGGWD